MKATLGIVTMVLLPAYELGVALLFVFSGSAAVTSALAKFSTTPTMATVEPAIAGWFLGSVGLVLFLVLFALFIAVADRFTDVLVLN